MSASERLIFDIGMNDGSDTEYYLSKGFHVVAVEASPPLIEAARAKFASEIAVGQLALFAGGGWLLSRVFLNSTETFRTIIGVLLIRHMDAETGRRSRSLMFRASLSESWSGNSGFQGI